MTDDAELLRQYATRHSDSAFAELVRRHLDLVYSSAFRIVGRDAHAAEDVAQAVFLALARKASELSGRRTLAGWLFLTTHHLAAQRVRSDCRRRNREHHAHHMNEILHAPDVDWERLRPVLDDTLAQLGDVDREAVVLRYFERKSFAEIGRMLRMSDDAARMRVDRALEKLRTALGRRGVSSTAGVLAAVLGTQVAAAPAGLAGTITAAVAGAATTGTGVVATATIPFMSTINIITGTVALVAVGVAVQQYSAAHHMAADLGVMEQNRAALQSRLDNAESRLAQASRSTAASRSAATAAPTAGERATVVNAPAASAATSGEAAPVTEERHQKVWAEARQGWLQHALAGYAPLFRKLEFSAAQADAFRALLIDNLGRHYDLNHVARTEGLPLADPDVAAVSAQSDSDLASRIQAQFGDAVYQAYQHFNDTAPVRELTGQLTETLAATATPLTPAQADQLVEILNNNRLPGSDGRPSLDPHALNLDQAVAQAQGVLSPPQIAALRAINATRR